MSIEIGLPDFDRHLDGQALEDLREREAWLAGQREAFALALKEASLADTLGILVKTATTALGKGTQAAFYLTDAKAMTLHHIVGMSDDHAPTIGGFEIGPESLACGLATHDGEPVLTTDVRTDPRWQSWQWLAEKFGYQSCWSFPIRTSEGRIVGTFALYWPEPREATPYDKNRAELITQAAAIIIARYQEAEERKAAEKSLRETKLQLQQELEDSELIRQISLDLADEDGDGVLYQKLVDAAAKIMHSDVCTVQYFHPDRGAAGELQMLASTGLNAEGVKYWEWVRADSGCTCGHVLRTGKRAIAEDVETCDFMAGTPDRDVLLGGGIRAGQSTPLKTRDGKFVGMISTHWGKPHRPSDRDLRMLDILARAAADLIERRRAADTQRLLLNELNHRVKNTLTIVQAMATRTLARTSDPTEFAKSFGGRVQALARTHDLLSAKAWKGADLQELILDQVSSGSADESRMNSQGPSVPLDPQMALHLALIFHELGTNATKYGALSTSLGKVSIEWELKDALHIHWTERGGPPAKLSADHGFGTTLITQSAQSQGGHARMAISADGVSWEIVIPYTRKGAMAPAMPPAGIAKPGISTEVESLVGRHLLVVEDEPLIGLDIVSALEEAGALVVGPIASIEAACKLIKDTWFDGALVDANLYGKPVGPIAKALVERNIPFAFATGYDKNGLPDGFREIAILSKPWSTEQVVRMAAQLVSLSPR